MTRAIAAGLGGGLLLRIAFLVTVEPLDLQSDEANYVYLALSWNYFGFFSDSVRYLWPPGYPALVAASLHAFGLAGLTVVKVLQVLASGVTGLTTALLARHWLGDRAGAIAAALWAAHLPLVGFTHMLWPETIFLALTTPALYFLVRAEDGRRTPLLVGAGVLLGAAMHVKEVGLYLVPVLAAGFVVFRPHEALARRLRDAALVLLAATAVALPWTLRNIEVYGRVVPAGLSVGENAYHGLNARYVNFDIAPLARNRPELRERLEPRPWFVDAGDAEAWPRALEIRNLADRLRENLRRGLRFAAAHPGWLVRSRIKKLADLFVPTSYFVRHQALGHYDHSIVGATGPRRLTVAWALGGSALLMAAGLAGMGRIVRRHPGGWVAGLALAYFLATSLLVANSRFRMPMVPILIVAAAASLTRPGWIRGPALWGVLALLAGLWWIDLPEIAGTLALAFEGRG